MACQCSRRGSHALYLIFDRSYGPTTYYVIGDLQLPIVYEGYLICRSLCRPRLLEGYERK